MMKMSSVLGLVVVAGVMGWVETITVRAPEKFVNVTVGGSVLLQCVFQTTPETSSLTIQWEFVPSASLKLQQVYYYQAGKEFVPEVYRDRIRPPSSPDATRNASITIGDVQPADGGVYTCDVHNFPDVDGQTQASVVVNVLERPSAPYCSVHGDVESGHLVTLTCHSERGSPTPVYTWTRLDQTRTGRPILGITSTNGVLRFANISQFEFGEYQCNATNDAGFSTCSVELSPEVANGVIAGAVIGALLGCVLVVLAVWFLVHTVKRRRYEAVKASEAAEMKGSSRRAQEAAEIVPAATGVHDETTRA